ncbi:MAG: anti-sigma factor [Bacteroidota bacterium]
MEQYVLGIAGPEERAEVERYIEEFPELRKQLDELSKGLEAYARAHTKTPPAHLRRKVLKAIKKEAGVPEQEDPIRLPARKSRPNWITTIAALMILGLTGICISMYLKQAESQEQIAVLSSQVQALQRDYQSLQRVDVQLKKQFAILKDIGTQHVQLQGSDLAPSAKAVVYWNENHQDAYLNVVDLPDAPHGHQYQVWADVNGKHLNMGLLEGARDTGVALFNLPYIEHSQGFVITLENKGGSPHPTVDKLFAKGNMY